MTKTRDLLQRCRLSLKGRPRSQELMQRFHEGRRNIARALTPEEAQRITQGLRLDIDTWKRAQPEDPPLPAEIEGLLAGMLAWTQTAMPAFPNTKTKT